MPDLDDCIAPRDCQFAYFRLLRKLADELGDGGAGLHIRE